MPKMKYDGAPPIRLACHGKPSVPLKHGETVEVSEEHARELEGRPGWSRAGATPKKPAK